MKMLKEEKNKLSDHGQASLSFEEIQDSLNQSGVRQTKKRRIILETFLKAEGHLTIEEILKRVRKVDSRIGYVTVYRTLRLLKDLGLAHQWHFGDGHSRFETVRGHHDHLICLKCGKIIEFEEEKIEKLQEEVGKKNHFKIVSHVHEVYGYCSQCHEK